MLNWFGRRLQEVQDKKASGEAGFTLIELLVVVIIIGILAAIAIPTFLAQRENAQQGGCVSDTRTAANAAISYGVGTNGNYTNIDGAALTSNGFRQSTGNTTTVTGNANSFTVTTQCASGGNDVATFASGTGTVTTAGF